MPDKTSIRLVQDRASGLDLYAVRNAIDYVNYEDQVQGGASLWDESEAAIEQLDRLLRDLAQGDPIRFLLGYEPIAMELLPAQDRTAIEQWQNIQSHLAALRRDRASHQRAATEPEWLPWRSRWEELLVALVEIVGPRIA